MAEKKNTFQIILFVVFGFAIVIAVAIFSISNGSKSKNQTSVVLWGTLARSSFAEALDGINNLSETTGVTISYVQKDPASYNSELIEAFASGGGPDIFLVNQDMLLSYRNKIIPLPYESFSQRDFQLRYVDGARVFMSSKGIMAFPLAVDPLVMYYNKSMFNNAGLSNPPTKWSQFAGVVPELTIKDENNNLLKSGLAFGQFRNIQYATNIFETLLLQLGNPIIAEDSTGNYVSVINDGTNISSDPLLSSLEFFTNFANPLTEAYSWNSVLPSAEDMFVQDRLAMFFAPASRFFDIQRKNINLNYDIARIPQVSDTSNFVTSGDFIGIAVAKNSPRSSAGFIAANLIANGGGAAQIVAYNSLAPVRRDLLTPQAGLEPYEAAIRESALISYTWLNPAPGVSEGYFGEAVDSVIQGALGTGSAARRIQSQLTLLLDSLRN
jgi:ABC-type glycerol-3-phosphate transport system substrate-binding protein